MPDLPYFSGYEPACLKCGHYGAAITFKVGTSCRHNNGTITYPQSEWLHRTCKECGYTWDEHPADIPAPQELQDKTSDWITT